MSPYEVTVFTGKLLFLLVSYLLSGADAMSPYEVTFLLVSYFLCTVSVLISTVSVLIGWAMVLGGGWC